MTNSHTQIFFADEEKHHKIFPDKRKIFQVKILLACRAQF